MNWNDWNGSDDYPPKVKCFTHVKILLRDGTTNESVDASCFHWRWYEDEWNNNLVGTHPCDIVKYIIV